MHGNSAQEWAEKRRAQIERAKQMREERKNNLTGAGYDSFSNGGGSVRIVTCREAAPLLLQAS